MLARPATPLAAGAPGRIHGVGGGDRLEEGDEADPAVPLPGQAFPEQSGQVEGRVEPAACGELGRIDWLVDTSRLVRQTGGHWSWFLQSSANGPVSGDWAFALTGSVSSRPPTERK